MTQAALDLSSETVLRWGIAEHFTGYAHTHRFRPALSVAFRIGGRESPVLRCACGAESEHQIPSAIPCRVHAPALNTLPLEPKRCGDHLVETGQWIEPPSERQRVEALGLKYVPPNVQSEPRLAPRAYRFDHDEDLGRAVRRVFGAAGYLSKIHPILDWFDELATDGFNHASKLEVLTIDSPDMLLRACEVGGFIVRGTWLPTPYQRLVGRIEMAKVTKEHAPLSWWHWLPGPRLDELCTALVQELEDSEARARARYVRQQREDAEPPHVGERLGPIEAHELTAKERRLRKRYEAARLRWIARHGLAGLSFARAA